MSWTLEANIVSWPQSPGLGWAWGGISRGTAQGREAGNRQCLSPGCPRLYKPLSYPFFLLPIQIEEFSPLSMWQFCSPFMNHFLPDLNQEASPSEPCFRVCWPHLGLLLVLVCEGSVQGPNDVFWHLLTGWLHLRSKRHATDCHTLSGPV